MFDSFDAMDNKMMSAGGIVPPIDMYETDTAVVVETLLPGIDPNNIEISVEGGILSIKGTVERKTEVDDKNYYRKEVRYGTVFRQVALPTSVSESQADAQYTEGVLKITLPKTDEKKKAIHIHVNKQ